MTGFRCTQCGATALPSQAASARRRGKTSWLGIVLALAAGGALLLGWRHFTGPPEAGAVVAGAGKVPLSKLAVPVRAQAAVSQHGRQVYLALRMTDAQGKPIRSVYLARGRKPREPEVSIVDDQGAVVYRCRLSYG